MDYRDVTPLPIRWSEKVLDITTPEERDAWEKKWTAAIMTPEVQKAGRVDGLTDNGPIISLIQTDKGWTVYLFTDLRQPAP